MPERKLKIAIPVFSGKLFGNYIAALEALGAAIIIADQGIDAADCDGLLLPGGGDIDPALYGQENRACQNVNRALDDLQMDALDRFARADRPVLGVCRGHQLINVYFGGTLIQHLPTSGRHSRDSAADADRVHLTRALPDSFLAGLYGTEFAVNSSHHQAVDAPGAGLAAVQWSDDGVVEAMRHLTLPIFSVQWHPERMCLSHRRADTVDGSVLLDWFLEQCAKAR